MKKILIFIFLIIFTTSFSFAASYQLSNFDKLSLYVYCAFAFCEEKENQELNLNSELDLEEERLENILFIQEEKKKFPIQEVVKIIDQTKYIDQTVKKIVKEQSIINKTYPTTIVNTIVKETINKIVDLDEVSDLEDDFEYLEKKIKSNRSLIGATLSVASDDLSDNFINDLSDVNAINPIDGQVLSWDSVTSKWVTGSMTTNSDTQDLSIVGHTISLVDGGSVVVPDNDTTYANVSEFVNDSGYLTTIGAQPLDALQNVDTMTEADDDILFFDTDGWNRLAHGTDGQILKYTTVGGLGWVDESGGSSLWTENGSDIYFNTGNVGIGNTVPRVALDIGDGVGGGGGDGAILAMGLYNSGWTEPNLGVGTRLMWYPKKAAFRAGYVNSTQWDDINIGTFSVAMGYGTTASGPYSTATGNGTVASGDYSTAVGRIATASGANSFAGGYSADAIGTSSFAVGSNTTASANYSTVMGNTSTASGSASFAVGYSAEASGSTSVALGYDTTASGSYSIATGYNTVASGNYSTAMGNATTASGASSVAIGQAITAGTGANIVAVGLDTTPRTCNQAGTMCIMGGEVGIGTVTPTAFLHLAAPTLSYASLRLEASSAVNPSSPNIGDLWFNGTNLNFREDGSTTIDLLASGGGAFTDGGTLAYYNGGNVGIGDITPDFKLELAGTSSVIDRKIGINDVQVVYLPDQVDFINSIFFGNGGQNLSYTSANDGKYNTGIGIDALPAITRGYYNTALGYQSLYTTENSGFNVAIGPQTLFSNTIGDNNTAIGYRSLYSNTSGDANVASGLRSLYSNTVGDYNIAMGYQALHGNVANSRSIAIGYNAMQYADNRVSGQNTYNIAFGYEALRGSTTIANNTGQYNIAIGDSALLSNSSGYNNTVTGYNALGVNTTGYNNTAIGYQALVTNTVGNENTTLGHSADVSGNNYSNAMALGYNASVTASNYVRIGNISVTRIGGQVAWSNLSDRRKKKNIEDSLLGLEFVNKLRPVTFNFKEGQTDILYTGLIAQEVEDALGGIEFSGLNKPVNDSDHYSLGYASFVTPLINAVQEIWNKVFTNQEEILELKEKFDEKDSEIEILKSELCNKDNSYSWCVQNIKKSVEPEPDLILGCTDLIAINYNSEATEDEGRCEFEAELIEPDLILGCTDLIAINYNSGATEDDGSCEFEAELIESDLILGCTDLTAINYNSGATEDDGSCEFEAELIESEEDSILGCTDLTAINYNSGATEDDGSCEL